MDEYKKYEPIFGSWYISRLIGKGSFGKVFEIVRKEYGTTYKSALKIITVPQDENDVKLRIAEGTELESISEYYEGILKEIINENEIMAQLKGNSNIVSYEDHQIIPHEDGVGYDILIRMELLEPLLDRMIKRNLDEKEVVRLGIDICKALETCHKKNIIHRDIKPQNIFISDNGDFKLGDFGIARTMEKTTGGMSKKGTYKYMAPEVFRGESYDKTVDIYSLGIVLYSLLNGNRGPFLPPPPAKVTVKEEEKARMRRFSGEPIPAPGGAGPMMVYIIQKACANIPSDRYQTASKMRRDLERYLRDYETQEQIFSGTTGEKTVIEDNNNGVIGNAPVNQLRKTGWYDRQPPADYYQDDRGCSVPENIPDNQQKKRNKRIPVILACSLLVAAIGAAIFFVTQANKAADLNFADIMTEPVISGYDGSGIIEGEITVDESERQDILDHAKDDDEKEKLDQLLESVVYTADVSEGLSNGDHVIIRATYDTDLAEELNSVVSGTETEIKVKGLKSFTSFSVDMADLMQEPMVIGPDGNGRIEEPIIVDESKKQGVLNGAKDDYERGKREEFLESIVYTADKTDGLSNGDTVNIRASYDNDLANELKPKITGTETSVRIEDLEYLPDYLYDATEFNGHYYRVVNESMYWDEAESDCEFEGGHLATINSGDEQAFIMDLIEDTGRKYNFWLGGTDEGHEGTWTWITGEPWGYTNWRVNQPDNGVIGKERDQNYLAICMVSEEDTGRYGKWWDNSNDGVSMNYVQAPYYKDTRYYGYIIEWDSAY